MNHRSLFSGFETSRSWMPKEYHYNNWNNAAVKKAVPFEDDYLIYGNIGVWQSDSLFSKFSNFSQGFSDGIDNRKIESILYTKQNNLYAATQFGLYFRNNKIQEWELIELPIKENRIIDIQEKQDSLFVLSRSHLLSSKDTPGNWSFSEISLPLPANYSNKISMFKTLWEIHSGAFIGTVGVLLVDLLGLIFIFLSISGVIFFIIPRTAKKRKLQLKQKLFRFNRLNIKWHNHLGIWAVVFLIITTFTGMFLRPPLLIPIANAKVDKIKYTHLDDPNPWNDKLRRLLYDETKDIFLLGTLDGIYECPSDFSKTESYWLQPPTSVMGINVFEKHCEGKYLVGSFSGLYLWQPELNLVLDYVSNEVYIPSKRSRPPIGNIVTSGYFSHKNGNEYLFEYNHGAIALNSKNSFPAMSKELLEQSPMSWWSLALELHTGRFYKFFLGDFYILVVPLFGLSILFILISGTIVWWRYHRKKKKENTLKVDEHKAPKQKVI